MTLQSVPMSLVKLIAPMLLAAATAWGAMAVERDHNAQTRATVEKMQAEAVPDAKWRQHVEDHFDALDRSLERIEHAVGSK